MRLWIPARLCISRIVRPDTARAGWGPPWVLRMGVPRFIFEVSWAVRLRCDTLEALASHLAAETTLL